MSAPLPLRFHNPVKDLCAKVNLDYETVIGTGLSASMREAYVLADVPKELKDITKKDIKLVQDKIDSLNRKYGGNNSKTGTTEGEVEDKGRSRYDAGIIVEPIQPDDCQMAKSTPIRYGLENTTPIKYTRKDMLWCPGRGVIPGSDLGMD
jgi:hypothetical protein